MSHVNEDITTVKRVALEAPATLGGLLDLIGRLPVEMPSDAELVDAVTYYACPEGAHENPDIEHEPVGHLALAWEWEVAE